MNAKESAELIGKHFRLLSDGLCFEVEVLNVRQVYGRTDYLVKPVAGTGERWVSRDRIAHILPDGQ